MRHIKPFLVTFTALVLICSIPLSASGFSIQDADMKTYKPIDKVSGNALGEFPAVGVWYQFNGSDYSSCGIYDSGNPSFAFIIWVPTKGYYLVSVQDMEMAYQLRGHVNSGGYDFYLYGTLYIEKNTDGDYTNSYYNWRGNGGFSLDYDSYYHFQTSFLGRYIVFHKIYTKRVNNTPQRSSYESYQVPNYQTPQQNLKDYIQQILNQYLGNNGNIDYPGGGSSSPTNPYGQTEATLPNGNPEPTYPNDDPVVTYTNPGDPSIHTVPYNPETGEPYPTIIYNGDTYILYPWQELHTDPDTGDPLPDPLDPSKPWIETVTIYNDENGKSDINGEFSKIYGMISDLDNLSSIAESNQAILSSHVSDTRNLITDITSWLPTPVIACLVCGAIMIIAVKITGSGKS